MKTAVTLSILLLFMATVSNGYGFFAEELQGVWSGPHDLSFLFVLTDEGVQSICRDELPPACEQQLPPGVVRIVFENQTYSFSHQDLIGITTKQESTKAFPACAKAGIYPVQGNLTVPPVEILSYDSFTGHLTYSDSRRPHDLNCIVFKIQEGQDVTSINANYVIQASGTLHEILETGQSLRCLAANGLCIDERNEDNVYTSFISLDYTVPCVEGLCMASK